jgi:glycosyltransferase involved in cell wall biosynthesis
MPSVVPNMLKVSVIVPIYNARPYLERAVLSVLQHGEVGECILVNDGSTDGSENLCRTMEAGNERVKYFSSPKGRRLGPGASRNRGLREATFEYIAFLDADDYYRENRFAHTAALFDGGAEAVAEAIISENFTEQNRAEATTMVHDIGESEHLFTQMEPFGKKGHFSLCGLTIKDNILKRMGYFSEKLLLTQDTEWIARLVLTAKVKLANFDNPVAIRGLHPGNSTKNLELLRGQRVEMCFQLLRWLHRNKFDHKYVEPVVNTLLKYHFEHNNLRKGHRVKRKLKDLNLLRRLRSINPDLIKLERAAYFRRLVYHLPVKGHLNFYK